MAHCIPNGPFWSLPLSVSSARLLPHASNTKNSAFSKHGIPSLLSSFNDDNHNCACGSATVGKKKANWILERLYKISLVCRKLQGIRLWLIIGLVLSLCTTHWHVDHRWEEVAYDHCNDTRLPHKLMSFVRCLVFSVFIIVASHNYFPTNLHANESEDTQMPDFQDVHLKDRRG